MHPMLLAVSLGEDTNAGQTRVLNILERLYEALETECIQALSDFMDF